MAEPVHVLLVEDDEDDAVLTQSLLGDIQANAHRVTWVRELEEGLATLETGDFQVCLVDYRLGECTGVDFIRRASRRSPPVPLILLTGQSDREVDLAAMQAGAMDYLNKGTITADLLERSIRYAIQNRRAEEQRIRLLEEKAARENAEAANQAKDQFLATLSHELRTPLTPVMMAVESLEGSGTLGEQEKEDLAIIRRCISLEARLIDDLLDLTRIARGKMELRFEVVDVHRLLEQAIHTCLSDPHLGKRLQPQLRPEAGRHHVWGDPARLQQVFWNLIRNAMKFTPADGEIEITTREVDGHGIRIDVRDTGIGMDPLVVPRVFNAFEQGDPLVTRQFGGLGLGLAISKALVDKHQGTITAESRGTGCGSTFRVVLPTISDPVEQPAGDTDPGRVSRTLSVLVVEDHEHTALMMARLLRKSNLVVRTAGDIASARQLAEAHAFDLVVSDLGLPDGNGMDLMRYLKERHNIKGIALSGYGMEKDKQMSLEAGFSEHLTKPVDFKHLKEAIARLTR